MSLGEVLLTNIKIILFLSSESFCVLLDAVIGRSSSYKYHIRVAYLRYMYSYVLSDDLIQRNFSYRYHINKASRLYEFSCVL
jgi:hypothetical protein